MSWWRHDHQNSGKPCSSRTSGPSAGPCSATWNRAPLAVTSRCVQGPSTRTTDSSGGMRPSVSRPAGRSDRRVLCPGGVVLERLDRLLRWTDLRQALLAGHGQHTGDDEVDDADGEEAAAQRDTEPLD